MSSRTKRKNLQKRRKRRLFAMIAAEIQASVRCYADHCKNCDLIEEVQWTLEKEELEQMRNEEERQRTHEKWQQAVATSVAAFNKRRKILAQRQQLIVSLRQQMQQDSGK